MGAKYNVMQKFGWTQVDETFTAKYVKRAKTTSFYGGMQFHRSMSRLLDSVKTNMAPIHVKLAPIQSLPLFSEKQKASMDAFMSTYCKLNQCNIDQSSFVAPPINNARYSTAVQTSLYNQWNHMSCSNQF